MESNKPGQAKHENQLVWFRKFSASMNPVQIEISDAVNLVQFRRIKAVQGDFESKPQHVGQLFWGRCHGYI